MLKYHNYDKSDVPLEILFNGRKLDLDPITAEDFINNMRNSYFGIFDILYNYT